MIVEDKDNTNRNITRINLSDIETLIYNIYVTQHQYIVMFITSK